MICWYCYWGWAKRVAEIYLGAVEQLKELGYDDSSLHFGPAHIVWEDENWDSAKWCIKHFNEYRSDYSDEELEVVYQSLVELSKIPMGEREPEPEAYIDSEGLHPELFPPADGVEMIKV